MNHEADFRRRAPKDPVWFIRTFLGKEPWAKQIEIIESVRDNPRTAARSCHGIGKTFIAAQTILWFLYTHYKSIVLSTAPTWRQVEKLIWKEIRATYNSAKFPLGGTLLPKSPELHIKQDQWYAAGLSTNEANRFQGFHEQDILVVVDEAAGVSEDIYEAIEGVLTSSGARLLLLGNPTMIGGEFYNAFRGVGYGKIHISAFDTPNFTAFGITPEDFEENCWEEKITGDLPNPKLITPSWAYDKYVRWGPNSIAYQTRVNGDYAEQGENTLIPLSWIEAAIERWSDMPEEGEVKIGVDVARYGDDSTVIAPMKGRKILALEVYSQKKTTETTGLVIQASSKYGTRDIRVDEDGLGSGVVDQLSEKNFENTGVMVSRVARNPERFFNLRSELWWLMREALDPNPFTNPNPIALPPDDDLLADLSGISYQIRSDGRIFVESKESMKKRLGRSPDRADAVVLANAPPEERFEPWTSSPSWL